MEEERGNVEVSAKVTEPLINVPNPRALQQTVPSLPGQSKYIQLLNVIEELGHEVRPTYAGSRTSIEKIKRDYRKSSMFRTLDTFDTEFSADSVEWCPIDSFKDVFVCGTYQLMKDENLPSNVSSKRLGRIYLFQIVQNGRLIILQKLEVPAVLDMKWAHVTLQNKILLGVVNSLGHLQIYQLKNDNEKITLELLVQKRVGDEVLALSLDWCTGRLMNEVSLKIVVSDSKGFVSLFELNENELNEINSWSAHGFEAWIAAFNYWDTNIIYSGGDDCKFQCIDTRIKTRVSNKVHGAGVTSIHSNAAREFLLSSGSYDEILRLWDTRNLKQPISNINLGGGIWRLKWDPFKWKYLLAACMYSGFRIVDCKNTEIPSVIGEYNEHESIAYGCDWSYLNSEEISGQILEKETQYAFLMTTCSFYDHVLKLSALYLKNN
ncbi:diphthine methyltransferase [Bombus flavifrons]|uniref:diphthine methyltransferase n=1 Tax=Bombus flavifrons TaxID=103934 RepID=UPI003704AFC0